MHERFEVPEPLAGERADRAVALLTGWSRADVQELMAAGAVLVDGERVKNSARLETGMVIDVVAEPAVAEPPIADASVELDVRHADPDVLVIAKPAGLVVHPGAGHETGTLVHGLLAFDPAIAVVGDAMRPGIVHRLDRDTSGLMVVALFAARDEELVEQLRERSVIRIYDTLVWGVPDTRRGVIDAPIGRSQSRRTRMAIRDEGREARTHYEVRARWRKPDVSRLECRLETGRTHQIRVHLSAIKHPVVGDSTYGGARQSLRLDRPFLHATTLSFAHPVTGEWLEFHDPLPAPLPELLASLGDPEAA